ncbi:unnamed protein product, partial [Cylicostephanus goldi]
MLIEELDRPPCVPWRIQHGIIHRKSERHLRHVSVTPPPSTIRTPAPGPERIKLAYLGLGETLLHELRSLSDSTLGQKMQEVGNPCYTFGEPMVIIP